MDIGRLSDIQGRVTAEDVSNWLYDAHTLLAYIDELHQQIDEFSDAYRNFDTCAIKALGCNEETYQRIKAGFYAGESAKDLAERYKVHRLAISVLRDMLGIAPRRKGHVEVTTPEQKTEIIRRQEAGESMERLAKDYGVSRGAIRTIIKNYRVSKEKRSMEVEKRMLLEQVS